LRIKKFVQNLEKTKKPAKDQLIAQTALQHIAMMVTLLRARKDKTLIVLTSARLEMDVKKQQLAFARAIQRELLYQFN